MGFLGIDWGDVAEGAANVGTLGGYGVVKGLAKGDYKGAAASGLSGGWVGTSSPGAKAMGAGEAAWDMGLGGYVNDLLGNNIPEYELNPDAFDLGQDAFNEQIDQSAFTYGEALDKSARAYQAGNIRDVDAIQTSEIRDPNLGAIERWGASGPAAVERYNAASIDPSQQISAENISETTVAPAAIADAAAVQRAQFDRGMANSVRGDQLQDIAMLRAGAQGQGPSAALNDYAVAMDAIAQEQLGLAGQARGADRASARHEAMLQIGRQGVVAARQAAATRAQEQQNYLAALQGATQGVRTADVDVATRASQLEQEANSLEAQLQTAVRTGNRDAINAINVRRSELDAQRKQVNAQLGLQASMSNAERQSTENITGAQLRQSAAADNAKSQNISSLDYAGRLDQAAGANAAAANQRQVDQAGLTLQRDTVAGAQSLQAQTTTNDQRLARDKAADDAGRSAFDSTTNAQLGALNTANGATGAGTAAASGRTTATQAQYDLALREKIEKEKRDAAERQSKRVMVAGMAGAIGEAIPG